MYFDRKRLKIDVFLDYVALFRLKIELMKSKFCMFFCLDLYVNCVKGVGNVIFRVDCVADSVV